jgi:hypothetical protein
MALTWTVTYNRSNVLTSFDVNHAGIATTIIRSLVKEGLVRDASFIPKDADEEWRNHVVAGICRGECDAHGV